jgi:hypothetical protein
MIDLPLPWLLRQARPEDDSAGRRRRLHLVGMHTGTRAGDGDP